jgi:hypothetical protein
MLPGARAKHLHWPLPDPAAVITGDAARLGAFREARDELARRIPGLFVPA